MTVVVASESRFESEASSQVWARVSLALRREFGEACFGSWLAKATIREHAPHTVLLVTQTGVARDWVQRNAWRRIADLWAAHDVGQRELVLKSRSDLADNDTAQPAVVEHAPRLVSEIIRAEPSPVTESVAVSRPLLQDRYSFDNFVVGPANEFAFAVARRVANWADGHFNPVVFHGPYGFGKTHLLNALGSEAQKQAPNRKVMYLTAEKFLTTFVRAVQDRHTAAFKEELRTADLLLIDDVHFVAGKQSTQEELFHTLAALMEEGRRVVVSTDRPPPQITELDPRLRSHLSAGLVCGIEPADKDLRVAILERKLAILGRQSGFSSQAKPEVMQFLADRFSDSVRELEGALNTLAARCGEGLDSLGLDEAHAILRPNLRGSEKRITVDDIQKATAEHFGLQKADLLSERRNRAIARPRQAAMWLAKQLTTRSLPDIGRRFGGRDHTTVLHAIRRIEALKVDDSGLSRDLEALTRKLRG
jgi:chromosomal replication initiator protein